MLWALVPWWLCGKLWNLCPFENPCTFSHVNRDFGTNDHSGALWTWLSTEAYYSSISFTLYYVLAKYMYFHWIGSAPFILDISLILGEINGWTNFYLHS